MYDIDGLWQDEGMHKLLVENMQDGLFAIRDGIVHFVNEAGAGMIGYRPAQMQGRPFLEFIAPDDRELALSRYQSRLSGQNPPRRYEIRMLHRDGSEVVTLISVGLVERGPHQGTVIGTIKNITEYWQLVAEVRRSERELNAIIDNLPDVFYRTDAQGTIEMISPSCEAHIGYTREEMLGRKMGEFYANPGDRELIIRQLQENNGVARQVEAALRHKSGETVWASTSAYMRYDDTGQVIGVEGISRNINVRKEMEMLLASQALHDELTGLPNRRLLIDRMGQAVERALRNRSRFAVILFDLDEFKSINDTFGHESGDRLLQTVAKRASEVVRGADTVARLAGDEFVIVLDPVASLADARIIAEKLSEQIAMPVPCGPHQCRVMASYGIALYPENGGDSSELLSYADRRMYQHKRSRQNAPIPS